MDALPKTGLPEVTGADHFNETARCYRWPMLCDPSCTFVHVPHRELLTLWRDVAGPSGIPYRHDMTARRLQPHMRSLIIYEGVEGDGGRRYRVRLIGSDIVRVFGELTGKFLDDVVPEKFLPRWYGLIDATRAAGVPLRFLVRSDTFDKAHMVAEYLYAPLRAEDGRPTLFLVAGHYDGTRSWTSVATEECPRLGLDPAGFV